MPIYMEWDGGKKIKGDVGEDKHKTWIALDSLSFSEARGIRFTPGVGANRDPGTPVISEVQVSKQMDSASVNLAQELLKPGSAKQGVDVNIVFIRTGEAESPYLKLKLEHTLLSAYSMSSGGGGDVSESLSLNFTKFEYSFIPMNEGGEPGDPITFTFDLTAIK